MTKWMSGTLGQGFGLWAINGNWSTTSTYSWSASTLGVVSSGTTDVNGDSSHPDSGTYTTNQVNTTTYDYSSILSFDFGILTSFNASADGPSAPGGGGEEHDCSIAQAIDNAAIQAANILAVLESQTGNEHGFLLGVNSDGSIALIGPFSSDSPAYIDVGAAVNALGGFQGEIVGIVHNHPAMEQTYLNPSANFNNELNRFLNGTDIQFDNALADRGVNISAALTHFVLGTDGVLRSFDGDRNGSTDIHGESEEVEGCPTS